MNAEAGGVRRDRWGRYLIVPPNGGKPTGYTRATTVAKALDDTSSLMKWGERMTAIGLAERPDLLALVATSKSDKRALDGICERAKEAGGATARRDLGTALHAMIEQSYTVPNYAPPAAYAADVAAVRATIDAAGFDVVKGLHERICVLDRHQIAGTFDLVLRCRSNGRLLIADVKTGASVTYGALAFAVQLAIYANADNLYTQGVTAAQDRRDPMPDVDDDEAIIIHVEPGSGRCDLHVVDIDAGYRALETAMAVRDWRKAKGLLTPLEVTVAAPANEPPARRKGERRDALAARIDTLRAIPGGIAALGLAWPMFADGVPTLKQSTEHDFMHLDQIQAAIEHAEARVQAPFEADAQTDAGPLPLPAAATPTPPVTRPVPDEGGATSDEQMVRIRTKVLALAGEELVTAKAWARQAAASGADINLLKATLRRFHLGRVVLAAAPLGDDIARAVATHVLDTDAALFPSLTFGDILGHLGADDAARLAAAFDAIGASLALTFTDDGTPLIVALQASA